MSQSRLYDLKSNLESKVSVAPGTNISGTTAANGDGVDCNGMEGPVHGDFCVGSPTGSPSSFTVTCKLQESDTSGGTYTDIATQTTLVLDAAKERGFIRALRSKRYVRAVVTPAFSGGTTPTIDTGANVCGAKQSY